MSWEIQIPHRSRDQALDAAALDELPRAIDDPEQRAITRSLLLQARLGGAETVGELIDNLEQSGPAQRRFLLDRARAAAGLPDTGQVDARAQVDAASRAGLQRPRPRLVLGPSGAFVDLAERDADTGRAAAEADSRQRQREAKLAERQAEAAEHADHERARAEALRREFPDPMMFPG